MTEINQRVRAAVYSHFVDVTTQPTDTSIASATGFSRRAVERSFARLANDRRLVITADGHAVIMAHPFSGIRTEYRACIGARTWPASCGWDAFAILSLLGDGEVLAESPVDSAVTTWHVRDGKGTPSGLVHFVVPPRAFWEDVTFT